MKPRVLIVNKFYYPRGGDCVCTLNLERLLKLNGHEVAVYAMHYPENLPSRYDRYFATNVDFAGGVGNKLRALRRMLGYGDVRKSFSRMLDDFKPDVVHLNNIHSYLSPVLAELAHARGCRVVWTLHDYKLLCPSYSCLCRGQVCEACFHDKSQVVKRRCMRNSMAASVIAYIEALVWNRKRLERVVDAFICPSRFMADKMIDGGFGNNRIKVICNFVDTDKLSEFQKNRNCNREDYYCYVGRLSSEKGIATLLDVASQKTFKLKVAGDGPIGEALRLQYSQYANIEFLGHCDASRVGELLSHARFSVLPSEWYENNPLGIIESLCGGTPVVGSKIGGITELIDETTGILFSSGNREDLSVAIQQAWERDWDYEAIATASQRKFAPEQHYIQLSKIYSV